LPYELPLGKTNLTAMSSTTHFVKRPQAVSPSAEPVWVPNTDVYVADAGLVIKVELAGMKKEHLELHVEGNRVKICGHRPDGCRAPKCKFMVMEINYGSFESIVELPPGYDLSQAKAAYQNGFLRIDVPMISDLPATIPISEGD
jgi:HSP20 family molecular chaperone IbpA